VCEQLRLEAPALSDYLVEVEAIAVVD